MLSVRKCIALSSYSRIHARYATQSTAVMKYLNVAEKNDAAKTIAGQLSSGTARRREGYSVYNKIYDFEATVNGTKSKMVMTSVSGHLLQLAFLDAYRNWNKVDPQSLFDAPVRKVCGEQYLPIKKTLEREVKSCQGLIIWTDCDREGENIGFEIIDVCRAVRPNIVVYRAIFSEITAAAVKRALQNLKRPDKRQSDAVDVRSELDLRTGASLTRFQTMRLQRLFPEKISDKLISYGSCQIPTLGFVAERYKEIEAFVSEPFWKIKVTHTIDDLTVEFNWARNRLFDKEKCEDFYLLCVANPTATVESVTVKPKSKWRPTPMDTVELEKLGSRKLKLSAKEVMTIAEKLYTKGIISYPRTETNMFSKEIDLQSLVQQQSGHAVWGTFAERVLEWGPNPRNGNKSDQAHPPIHPTKMVANLDGNEGRVYELICRHFLACVSKDATGSETIVAINIAGEKFSATGLVIYERNYLDVYIYDKWSAKQIHKYEQGQQFEPTEITMPEGHTTAPPLLTEADLIALMEKHGIGTDATHAEHINTIKERGYIGVVDNGSLVPGVIGMGLYEGYDAMELALAKPLLRAEFEVDLKKICLGEKEPQLVLSDQIAKYKAAYKQIMEKITAMDEKMALRIQENPKQRGEQGETHSDVQMCQEVFKCPKCSVAPMVLKKKNNGTGHFIGCMNYPSCKHCIWFPDDCKDPTVLEEHCPKCGSEYKLIKMRFAQPYHKNLFNAPSGWYKTCLQCDSQFRNAFDINAECVKRTGRIVSDVADTPINYGSATVSNGADTKRKKATGSKTEKPSDDPKRKSKKTNTSGRTAAVGSIKAKKTTASSSAPSIRSYFSSATASVDSDIAIAELHDLPLDELFDSNDGFEDIVRSASSNNAAATRTPAATNTEVGVLTDALAAEFNDDNDDFFASISLSQLPGGPVQSVRATNDNTAACLSINNSLSEVFADNNDFDDYVWGSAAKNAKMSELSEPAAKKPKAVQEESTGGDQYQWGSSSRLTQLPEVSVKCSGCHQPAKELTVKKQGPNIGRIFYACAKSNPCKFFLWADEAEQMPAKSRSSDSAAVVNCGCNQPASCLPVRKEGPNRGREFYTCSNRDQSCGFFQWADEIKQEGGAVTPRIAKARKCGLCRQEGHSRLKCPRKAEFEF